MTRPIHGPYFIDHDRAAICTRCEESGEIITLAMFTEWGERERVVARAIVAKLGLNASLVAMRTGAERYRRALTALAKS
jgi:hypothetical protein